MIATTYRGESVYLLPYAPNWKRPIAWRPSVVADTARSLGGREARRSFGYTLRTRFSFSLLLGQRDSADFRIGLQAQANKRILCPFWPMAHLYYSSGAVVFVASSGEVFQAPGGEIYQGSTGEGPSVSSGVWLTFEPGFTAYEIHETDEPAVMNPTANAIRVPLMLGIFEKEPEPEPITSTLLPCTIAFRETSEAAFALRPASVTFATGPALTSRTPFVFPLRPNWGIPVTAGQAHFEIDREDIGFSRNPAETYYPQKATRIFEAGFSQFSWAEIGKLIGFFHQRRGPVESFWLESVHDECELASPSSSGSALITVDRAASLGENDFIAFLTGRDAAPVLRRIQSVNTGTNVVTLDSPPGVFQPGQVRLVALVLARFQKPELNVTFRTDRVAEASIGFIETPEEYVTPAGETEGTTMGGMPTKAYLFRFTRKYPGLTVIDRFTSYERTVVAGGELFEKKGHFEHEAPADTLDVERTKVRITSRAFEGNPLMLFVPNRLEVPLWLEVLECTPDADGNAGAPQLIFGPGKVKSPRLRGPIIECEAVHQLQDLLSLVPRALIQPTCNYELFSGPCGLIAANWTFSGTVVAATATTLTLGSLSWPGGALPSLGAGYFAFGRVWFGSGSSAYETRTIFNSTAISGGQIVITLQQPFRVTPSGSVSLTPGCDGTRETCASKFSNYARFGGFPFVPPGNPSLVPVKKSETAGGKK